MSVRVPFALKEAIERYAANDRRTVADVVIMLLEESVEIERVRRMSDDEARREWSQLFPRSARQARQAARRAGRERLRTAQKAKRRAAMAARKGGK